MAIKIDVPDAPESFSEVTLSGKKYVFHFRYSTLEDVYYFDIAYNGSPVISGLRMSPAVLNTAKYDLPAFKDGVLGVFKLKETPELPNRNNVGIGKDYELIYFPYV